MNKKVILVGHFGVGKTSLVKRFVHSQFSEDYITTIGVKIDKKIVEVEGRQITLLIWDIAGENDQQKVPASYRLGAHGAFYVFDLTRPATYEKLQDELAHIEAQVPGIPMQILGNKKDLLKPEELEKVLASIPEEVLATSAKTGELVDHAFEELTKKMIE